MRASRSEQAGTYLVLGAFALIAIYPVLSIFFLALHQKSDLVSGLALPTHPNLSSFNLRFPDSRGSATNSRPGSWSVISRKSGAG